MPTATHPPQPKRPHAERQTLTWSVLRVLDAWSVPTPDQVALLGLGGAVGPAELGRCRIGTPLPETGEVYQRAALLLGMDEALHQIFPHSEQSANLWITSPLARFGRATPLELLLRGDLETMRRLAGSLDNLDLF